MTDRSLTMPEAVAATTVSALSVIALVAYVWARVGRLSPVVMLVVAILTVVSIAWLLFRRATRDDAALLAFLGVLVLIVGWLLWLARPALLPSGGGPDLAHHLQLVDFIERHWQLPDAPQAGAMGEMAHYTPGLHLLAALAGAWSRTDGLHALVALVAFTVALKSALLFLVAMRLLPDGIPRVPVALVSVVLVLLPQAYFVGAFLHDSFLAQVVGELFAVAMWWALVAWACPAEAAERRRRDHRAARTPLVLFGVAGAGAFLTWPIWIGPPLVALAATVLTREDLRAAERIKALCIAGAPVVAIAMVHAAGRVGWLGMAGTTGAVLRPSIAAFGWPFLIVAGAGIVAGVRHRAARTTVLFALSIAVQGLTLYVVARQRGASTPYMAFKMGYLLIFPLAALGALAIGTVWGAIAAAVGRRSASNRGPRGPRYTDAIAWGLLLFALIVGWRPLTTVPLRTPIVSDDLYEAGRWARGHLEAACVDYLVPHPDTAYWLHLAVLGNPRASLRTANPDTFAQAKVIARWIQRQGLPYGIAHLPTLPKEVLDDVDVLEEFGTAAVIKQRGLAECADAQRFAGERDRVTRAIVATRSH